MSEAFILNDRYRLTVELGSGGMAVVYKAIDLELGRQVAVKLLREGYADDTSFLTRFQQEARAAASLDHPNVVSIYDVGRDGRLILTTATRILMPMLFLFSAFILFRGHNLPGGGFIGGLVASATFILHSYAYGVENTRKLLRISPRTIIGVGLLVALGSGCVSLFVGKPFMTGQWGQLQISSDEIWHLGTPFFFDVGVYLVVIGAVLTIILSLAEGD